VSLPRRPRKCKPSLSTRLLRQIPHSERCTNTPCASNKEVSFSVSVPSPQVPSVVFYGGRSGVFESVSRQKLPPNDLLIIHARHVMMSSRYSQRNMFRYCYIKAQLLRTIHTLGLSSEMGYKMLNCVCCLW
jgi:hypothetical protein